MFVFLVLIIIIYNLYCKQLYFDLTRYFKINFNPEFNIQGYLNLIRVNKEKPVIISFTTLPKRIQNCKYMLSSILSQTRRVDKICLYIPLKTKKGETYNIPDWMIKLQHDLPLFHIYEIKKDLGPATKVIPPLLREKDSYIIYIDDDTIYHKEMIETLVSISNKYKNKAIGNSGFNIKNRVENYNTNENIQTACVLEGYGGVIVHTLFFKKEFLDIEKYPEYLFYNDDVLISGLLKNNKIQRIITGRQRSMPYLYELVFGFLLRINPTSLSSTVNKDRVCLNKSLKYFKMFH